MWNLQIGSHTVVDLYNLYREICMDTLQNPRTLVVQDTLLIVMSTRFARENTTEGNQLQNSGHLVAWTGKWESASGMW
jgi:hypothetical protein